MLLSDGKSDTGHSTGFSYATYSPDGRHILYRVENQYRDAASSWSSHGDIYRMNVDGSNAIRLTTGLEDDSAPVFSPNGSRIVFRRSRKQESSPVSSHIYVMNADGSNPQPVTQDDHWSESPSFSPDGRQIVYQSTRDTTTQRIGVSPSRVCVVNVDGTNRRYLPERPGQALPAELVDTITTHSWTPRTSVP